MDELQRYQKYVTPSTYWNTPEQPLVEARTFIDYVPIKKVEPAPATEGDQDTQEQETTDAEIKNPLNQIKTVKTFLLVAEDDKTCKLEQAKIVNDLIPTVV